MDIRDYSSNGNITARILNALWNHMYPDEIGPPLGWHPSRARVRELNLRDVPNLSRRRQEIIQRWLTDVRTGER